MRRNLLAPTLVLALVLAAPASARFDFGGRVRNVLPPGQSGAIPADPNSTDQLALYDDLTPLLGDVSAGDVRRHYKSERFGFPGAAVRRESTGRSGLKIERDGYDVPHITGKKRADVMFGTGWVTAEDRSAFIETLRGPARISALDVPGLDAFTLAASLRQFQPSAQTESFLHNQVKVYRRLGRKGRQLVRDVKAYTDGINAYYRKTGNTAKPWTLNDVTAMASIFGSKYGKGGGAEVLSSQLLASLQQQLGQSAGAGAWRDLREAEDPEAPVTVPGRFRYTLKGSISAPGSAVVDPGSVSASAARAAAVARASKAPMSNALLVARNRSATGHPIAVMGPQVGYYYPQVLMEEDLHGGGIDARGAAFPGVSLYVLLGRGKDFAWSATTSTSDNVDQFLDELCEPDGSAPTRRSTHYRYKGHCRSMTTFDAGLLKGAGSEPDRRIVFQETVHGPVSGTATVHGKPYAISNKRSTRGREAVSAMAFADLNANKVHSARDFARVMNEIEYSFNWYYADDHDIAYFSSGRLPKRAKDVNPSLPTLGTGRHERRGFLSQRQHPQAVNPRGGMIVNWNNKPARGFNAADDQFGYGSVHRVDLFKGFKRKNKVEDVVSVMNRAATQDLRAVEVWPRIRDVLAGGAPPDARSGQAAALVSAWERAGASRLDKNLDGKIDDPGAAVLDAAWPRLATTVLSGVLRDNPISTLTKLLAVDDPPSAGGSAYFGGWYGYVDKDLRALLGKRVRGRFSRGYCGNGQLAACRTALWQALQDAADSLAASQGTDPSAWRADATAERIKFAPGVLPRTMRWTNRPTFQQVVDFRSHRPRH